MHDQLSPQVRSLYARAAAHASWAKTEDRSQRTAKARDSFMARFERQVDPDGTLPPAERAQRAEAARQAYFLTLSAKAAAARTARARRAA
jgi:hypothetical protein